MDPQFTDSFAFGVGRISFRDGWYRIDSPVQSIKIEGTKAIITTPCVDLTGRVDTVPLYPHIIELRRGLVDMDFGRTQCPMRRGLNSIMFEVLDGSFNKYGVPDEVPNTTTRTAAAMPNLRSRCGHCPQHGPIRIGRHTRFGVDGEIRGDNPNCPEEKYPAVHPFAGREIIDLSGDNARPAPPVPVVPAMLRTTYASPPFVAVSMPTVRTDQLGARRYRPPLPPLPPLPPPRRQPRMANQAADLGFMPMGRCYRNSDLGSPDPMEFMSDAITVTEARATDVCVICRCSYEIGDAKRWLPCFHAFHARCIDRWVHMERDGEEAPQCPICKTPLDELAARVHDSS